MLFNILKSMVEKLPNTLIFEWTILRNSRKYKYLANQEVLNPSKSKGRIECIDKCDILIVIQNFIFNTKVHAFFSIN